MAVRGTAVSHPVATRILCADQSLKVPQVTRLYGNPLQARQRAIIAKKDQTFTIDWTMVDAHGNPINLASCLDVGSVVSSVTEYPEVKLRIREQLLRGNTDNREYAGEVLEESTGRVRVTVEETAQQCFPYPGIYWAEIALVRGATPVFSNVFALNIEKSLFGSLYDLQGPPTLAEIRLQMRDSDPGENLLLDAVEFDDAEIAACIVKAVRYWNEIPPPIGEWNSMNFEYRGHWIDAVIAGLYKIAAHWYRRNHLQYQAGGLAVDDLGRAAEYDAIGERMWAEWQEFVRRKKVEINLASGYGCIPSPYNGYPDFW